MRTSFVRPPLGWSALYGAPFSTVNETIVRIAAQGLVDGGFAAAGYEYVNLDDWYAERGPDGRIRGIPSTFPSGMNATSAFIHGLGLKFGVYSAASQRTCGNYSASQFLEQLDADTFANDWQIDFLKYDSCIYNNGVAARARYTTMRDALNATGRPIFYSMEGQAYFPDVGNMVRSGGDIWPEWDACVLRNLYSNNALTPTVAPGSGYFLDPDMIQATGTQGGGALSFDEARSQFVLWAVMRAPLILGALYSSLATMRTEQPEYFQLLTHPELIAIDQDPAQAATLRLSMPSAVQRTAGAQVALTLQACDPARGDQAFGPGPGTPPPELDGGAGPVSAIQSLYGSLCVSGGGGAGASVVAEPCTGNVSSSQGWETRQDSQLHVVPLETDPTTCLTVAPGDPNVTVAACEYSGALPPPFDLDLGAQLWVWDATGAWRRWCAHRAD
jgi:hypothetical protein